MEAFRKVHLEKIIYFYLNVYVNMVLEDVTEFEVTSEGRLITQFKQILLIAEWKQRWNFEFCIVSFGTLGFMTHSNYGYNEQ